MGTKGCRHSQCPDGRCLIAAGQDPGVAPLLDSSWGGRAPNLRQQAQRARQADKAVVSPLLPVPARPVQRPGEPHESGAGAFEKDSQLAQLVALAAHRRLCHGNHHATCRGFVWVVYDDKTGLPKIATYADGSLKGKRIGGQLVLVPETAFLRCRVDARSLCDKCQDCQREAREDADRKARQLDRVDADLWLWQHGERYLATRRK